MTKSSVRVLVSGLVLFAAAAAFGQTYHSFQSEWTRVADTARFRLGPLRIFPSFSLKNLGWGDNVYFENAGVRDFTATLSPAVEVYWPLRHRLILYVRESPEYVFFLKESRQRALTNSYTVGGRMLVLNRIVLFGEYFSLDRQRGVSVELARPTHDMQQGARAGAFYETARQTSFGLTAATTKQSYRDIPLVDGTIALVPVLNRTETTVAFEVYYHLLTDVVVFTSVGQTAYDFADDASGRDSTSIQGYVGVRFPLLGRLSGTLSLGYKSLTPKAGDKEGFSGLVGNTALEMRPGRFSVRLAYVRDCTFSYFANAFFFIEDRYGAGGSAYLTNFLRLDYNFNLGFSDYPGVTSVPQSTGDIAEIHRRDRRRMHDAAVVFRVFRKTGIGLQFSSERWTSSLPDVNRKRDYFGVYVTSQF